MQRGNKYLKVVLLVILKGNRSLGRLPNIAQPQSVGFPFVIIKTADIFHINYELHQHSELGPIKIKNFVTKLINQNNVITKQIPN